MHPGNVIILLEVFFRNCSHLKAKDDDEKDAICGQQHSGLFDRSTIAEEANDEDESPESNENVAGLVNNSWLNKFLKY